LEQFGNVAPAFMVDWMTAAKDAARRSNAALSWTDKVDGAIVAIGAYLLADFDAEGKYWQRLDERGCGYVKELRDLIMSQHEGRPGEGEVWRETRRRALVIVADNYLADHAWRRRATPPDLDGTPDPERPRGRTTWKRGDRIIGTRRDLIREWEKTDTIVEDMDSPYREVFRALMETDNLGGTTGMGFKKPAAERMGASEGTYRRAFEKGKERLLQEWSR
jgi:hypothetical protein